MELEQNLAQIGLLEREVKIYLATLELGSSTVLPIAQKAGIKRTYAYDIFESLKGKGLVTYVEKNGRRRYSAEPPEKIGQLLKNRLENFSRILPELKSIYNQASTKPHVRFYEGIGEIEAIYDQMLEQPEYMTIASADELEKRFHDYLQTAAKIVIERDIRARELLVRSAQPIDFVRGFTTERQQVRWLPAEVKLQTDMLLFGNTLVLISYGPDIHAVVIEDSAIVDTHKQLFELLWQTGATS